MEKRDIRPPVEGNVALDHDLNPGSALLGWRSCTGELKKKGRTQGDKPSTDYNFLK
jgi:hypothetical protein